MNREGFLQRLASHQQPWDLLIVGGGATGLGIAVDAASRGYAVALFEQSDFGKGTSSRSTKLIHGGVRYLQQGNIALVKESLLERGRLLRNAPHLVHDLEFIVPNYAWWEVPFYGIGMKVYDLLSGRASLGPSQILSRAETLQHIPTLEPKGLRGGVKYHDGQFDDARLLINLAQTAADQGAVLLNYARVTELSKNSSGRIGGLSFRDEETGEVQQVVARAVINATGPFCDELRRMDDSNAKAIIAPSQGIHLVLGREFLPGDTAIMVPRTRDGRVMFAIPWHEHTLLGTTDTPIAESTLEPIPQEAEIDFLLETAGGYLAKGPTRADILSMFTGIRPLVKAGAVAKTSSLARDHTIVVSSSGLLTITGGKWTTYRKMAEDAVDRIIAQARLQSRPCITADLRLHGCLAADHHASPLEVYGSDAPAIEALLQADQSLGARLHPDLPILGAQVRWAARHEFARTVEDVLARRTRALFLNSRAALAMAPEVARLLARELGRDESWQHSQRSSFEKVAAGYLPPAR